MRATCILKHASANKTDFLEMWAHDARAGLAGIDLTYYLLTNILLVSLVLTKHQ